MIDIMLVVVAIAFAIWVYFEIKDTLKTNKKYRDECDIRIEWFKNNMGLTSELKKKGENDNVHLDL